MEKPEGAANPEGAATVLVVDDDRDHREALAKVFERAGYCVCTACDGQEALTIVAERHFELIVTDLCMPRLNGLQFLRRARVMNPQAAVIVITAFGEWSTYVEAMDCGCADYMSKPVRRVGLLLAARKALARRGISAPGVSSTSSGESGATPA